MTTSVKGIPNKIDYGDISKLPTNKLIDFIIQRHEAERAGLHKDIRFGTPEHGLHSFATRKELPQPGGRISLFQQPLHDYNYKDFEGSITEGYGKGTVKKEEEGKVLINKMTDQSIHFSIMSRKAPERFVLVKPGPNAKNDKNWLLINTTPSQPLDYTKPKYKLLPQEEVESVLSGLEPTNEVQPKIDGAQALIQLTKTHPEIYSPRTSVSGRPIVHTERVFGESPRSHEPIPKDLVGTRLIGELFGTDKNTNKPISAQATSGILNATPANSIQMQKDKNVDLRSVIFDIDRYGKNKLSTEVPYRERKAKINEVLQRLSSVLPPDKFSISKGVNTPEEALDLWDKTKAEGGEGVVIHPKTGMPSKAKLRQEHDVIIRGFEPATGKYKDNAIGAFTFSHYPEGPIVGKVGTGIDDVLRRQMFTNPSDYIGRTAKVTAQEKYPTGALKGPALISLHEDISPKKVKPVNQGPEIQQLLQAKAYSDNKLYKNKHAILSSLIKSKPDNWLVDSLKDTTAGLTHSSGFRIHLPIEVLPEELFSSSKNKENNLAMMGKPSKIGV